ncbi:hypothetical protein [Methylobacterium brachythecii]|uniref:Uncharacterized protein n=1 Tax=Methylobacterium brachythecii TaxID=1176177 RepID=A0A7W6AGF6_9HYPH|nr:hypothetical protein [Methylobacterium brachythecii]MBB3902862.1 hypothetical protein [Methylobacterium brachythecii]GLS43788.1 hypothetical protein GCM10007884_17730 [Methylobacterium brachythecii]
MDAAYISALAALSGSAIGALASFATTWLTQHAQARATLLVQDRARREALYGEFIREASTLFGDAFRHEFDDPAKLVNLYARVSKIRLFGEPDTLREAERVMQRIGETYFSPNKDLAAFASIRHAGDLDPLCEFSSVCRKELAIARR